MNKLPLKEKIFYVVANIGNIPVITLVSSYLSIQADNIDYVESMMN